MERRKWRIPLVYSNDDLRRMYAGHRGDRVARGFARFWSVVFAWGLAPRRWVTLEVRGRTSGRPRRFPIGLTNVDGSWFAVSMLGESCHWVRNVRATQGVAVLCHGRSRPCRLVDVAVEDRAPILQRYLQQVPGARPHIRVDRNAPRESFENVAEHYPVFRVVYEPRGSAP